MSTRTGHRARIAKLEAFVLAFDDFIGASQHLNTMNAADAEYPHVAHVVKVKQQAVQRARAEVGKLDG